MWKLSMPKRKFIRLCLLTAVITVAVNGICLLILWQNFTHIPPLHPPG